MMRYRILVAALALLVFSIGAPTVIATDCCQYVHQCFDTDRYPNLNATDCVADGAQWKANHYCDAAGEYCEPKAGVTGSLVTTDGRGVSGNRLRQYLDHYVYSQNPHSALLVLTQCYGGDMVSSQTRAGTHVCSATSPCQKAYYGGYDDDAARALEEGAGRTSAYVHTAGTNGRHPSETPSESGNPVSLEPVTGPGPIISRHVLVYAGKPGGSGMDNAQRTEIYGNFNGDPNTTVTSVGGAGGAANAGAGWQHPGTEAGLRAALATIGAQMGAGEQFIMFVTDHGDKDAADRPLSDTLDGYVSDPLQFPPNAYTHMLEEGLNIPGLTIFVEGEAAQEPCAVSIGEQYFEYVPFVTRVDINDNSVQDPGDGWEAWVELDETLLSPDGDTVWVMGLPQGLDVGARLSTGAIPKVAMGIPTVSEWGLIVMVALLLTGTAIKFGRRRRAASA